MTGLIIVHPNFEKHWPFVADELHKHWQSQDETHFIRLPAEEELPLGQLVSQPDQYKRVVSLSVPVTVACLKIFTQLQEAAFLPTYGRLREASEDYQAYLDERGIQVYSHQREGFWGQSVSECALALTLSALRRIPQQHHEIITSHEPWLRYRAERNQGPGTLGAQFCDDLRFTHGTAAGKRVRIVGAGNIGSRYASFMTMLGADVAAWDPFAPGPAFHRAGSRKIWHLAGLMHDAEIFAPMLPLSNETRGLVTAEHIESLPKGCLVVLITRAAICDMPTLRRRVCQDELALAADVFDVEPLPLDDPLLNRANVVHTPHIAGRTFDANRQWALDLAAQFRPVLKP